MLDWHKLSARAVFLARTGTCKYKQAQCTLGQHWCDERIYMHTHILFIYVVT